MSWTGMGVSDLLCYSTPHPTRLGWSLLRF